MKKKIIGLMLFIALASIGTTYGYWNNNLIVRMTNVTGSFDFVFKEETPITAVIVDKKNQVLEEIDGVEVELSYDNREADITFTQELPVEWLMEGNYISIKYPMEWEEGAVFPRIDEEPDFSKPAEEPVMMEGKAKGILVDGVMYDYLGEDEDYSLSFDLFNQVKWEDEELYGYIFLTLNDEAMDTLDSLNETSIEIDEVDLLETGDDMAAVEADHGLVVEYSGTLSVYLEQMNDTEQNRENQLYGNGD